jgi:hypothetical protein
LSGSTNIIWPKEYARIEIPKPEETWFVEPAAHHHLGRRQDLRDLRDLRDLQDQVRNSI